MAKARTKVRVDAPAAAASPEQTAAPSTPPSGEAAASAPLTPSLELIKEALKETVLTDETGRKITLRKPSALAQLRIVQAAGPENAANQTLMQMVNPLIYVSKIDDLAVHMPTNWREIEALWSQLGEEGLAQVIGWYMAYVQGPTKAMLDAEIAKANLKNL